MSVTIKALLDTRRIKSDQTYPLVIRVTYNRKSFNIPVGYALPLKECVSS